VTFFSIKRTQQSDATEDFQIALNGKSYAAAGKLARFKTKDFPISPMDLADQNGVIALKASIKGNHYGMANLIYRGPVLMGRNARYKVNSIDKNTFDITLTTKLSGFENVFKMFPFSTKYGGVGIGHERWRRCASREHEQESVDHERHRHGPEAAPHHLSDIDSAAVGGFVGEFTDQLTASSNN
jgi:hypothetical protein